MFEKFKSDNPNFILSEDQSKKLNDGKVIYLFGKNGSGKTTLSREIESYFYKEVELFIFNEDYISKNLYVQDLNSLKSEVKQLPSTKENTFKIFFGKELINLKDKLDKKIDYFKQLKDQFNSHKIKPKYMYELKEVNLEGNVDLKSWNDLKINDKNIIKNMKNFNDMDKIKKEFDSKFSSIKNYKDQFDFYKEINDLKKCIKDQNKNILQINSLYKEKIKNQVIIDFHENSKNYFEKDTIEFLEKEYHLSDLEKYLEKWKTNKNEKIELFAKNNKKISNKIINIEKNNLFDNLLDEKNKNFIMETKKRNSIKIDTYSNENAIFELEEEIIIHGKKEIKNSFGAWLEENKWYLIDDCENLNDLFNKIIKYDKNIKLIKKEITEKTNDLGKSFIEKLNNHIKTLSNENFNILFELESVSNRSMIKLYFNNNRNFNSLSAGEKSIISFAYFLTDLENNLIKIKKPFIVFIDDPFDSNDHYKYDNFSKIKFENMGLSDFIKKVSLENKVKSKLIITTHNIHILMSFIRSLRSEHNEDFFIQQNDLTKSNIFVKEIVNHSNKININDIDIKLFFPIEKNITEFLKTAIEKFMKIEKYNDIEIQIFKLILCLLIKIYDSSESELRAKYKSYIKEHSPKWNVKEEKVIKIRDIPISFKEINKQNIKIFLDKYSEKKEYSNDIVIYLNFIKTKYEKIFLTEDQEQIKRMRHKIFTSTLFNDILEE